MYEVVIGDVASVAEFVENLSEELLDDLSKKFLLKVTENFDMECPKQVQKGIILSTLKAHLVEQEGLPSVEKGHYWKKKMHTLKD